MTDTHAVDEIFDEFKNAWTDLKGYLASPPHSGCYKGAGMVLLGLVDHVIDELETHLPDGSEVDDE